jgi:ORF6N domain
MYLPASVGACCTLESIENLMHVIRGEKVILDRDLAGFFDVSVTVLNDAVKCNRERFPSDFVFQLTTEETRAAMKSQRKQIRRRPYAFTEIGVFMVAGVLETDAAIKMSVQFIRSFIHQCELLATRRKLTSGPSGR